MVMLYTSADVSKENIFVNKTEKKKKTVVKSIHPGLLKA